LWGRWSRVEEDDEPFASERATVLSGFLVGSHLG
jgi:hypothetical protein